MIYRKPTAKLFLSFIIMALLILSACTAGSAPAPTAPYWPTDGWLSSTPEEQGFDSAKLAEALQTMRDNQTNIHSLMIIRHGDVILDAYFYPYDGTTVHELASVTKSVITTLIGIAADQGQLRLDDKMVSFFPERSIANRGPVKNFITVRQLTKMASGLDCTAENDEQTLTEMGFAEDWVQFTLDLKVKNIPGTHFEYCSPGMHVLSAILQQATGETTADFAQTNLFEPLGIKDFLWDVDPQGTNDGWAGLNLQPRDLAKIGYLMLYQGQWDGSQIVSRNWVEEATSRQIKTGRGDDYGYGWWVPPPTNFVEFTASGRGGQYVRVFPDLDLIVVTTGNGFEWEEIVPLLVPTMGDMVDPLPANPQGIAQLNDTLAAILEPPAAQAVQPLPEIAATISGRTYLFEPNPLNLKTVRLDFDDSAEARLQVTSPNQPDQDLLVGLDGVYRLFPVGNNGLNLGLRGSWIDSQTFLLEYDQIANIDAYSLTMRFEGDKLFLEAKERTHEAVITVNGVSQDS